jgi:methionyl-tRNA formyltransferase
MRNRLKIFFLFDKKNNYRKKYFCNFKNNTKYIFKSTYLIGNIKKADIVFFIGITKILDLNKIDSKLILVLHESPLPKYRGGSPIQWQILKENKIKFFMTIFQAKKELDSGNILFQNKFSILRTDIFEDIKHKQAVASIATVKKFLKIYPSYKIKKQKGNPTYFRMRRKDDNELNINKSIKSQFNLLRVGNNNSFPSFFYFQKKKYILKIFKGNSV